MGTFIAIIVILVCFTIAIRPSKRYQTPHMWTSDVKPRCIKCGTYNGTKPCKD